MKRQFWDHIDTMLSIKKPTTISTYLGALKLLCEFLNVEMKTPNAARALMEVDQGSCVQFISWLKKRKGCPRYGAKQECTHRNTISHKIVIYKSIFSYLVNMRIIESNPWQGAIVSAHAKRVKPTYQAPMIPFNMVMKIIDIPNEKTFRGLRDKAMLCLFLGGALRLGEVTKLRLGNVLLSPGGTTFIRLHDSKSGGQQDQPLPDWAGKVVLRLVAKRIKQGAINDSPLFVRVIKDKQVRPLYRGYISDLFKKYVGIAGLEHKCSPHSARATAITRLLDLKMPYRKVQAFSRHSSIQGVEKYDRREFGVDAGVAKKLKY